MSIVAREVDANVLLDSCRFMGFYMFNYMSLYAYSESVQSLFYHYVNPLQKESPACL